MIYITYRWYGFHPSHAFDIVTMAAQTTKVETKSRDGITFEPAKPGATLEDVNDWMLDHNQKILLIRKICGAAGSRNGGKILAIIGTEADRQHLGRETHRPVNLKL